MGEFDRTLSIATHFKANPDSVDLLFANVPVTAKFTLSYIAADGTETIIVKAAPYGSLNDFSEGS